MVVEGGEVVVVCVLANSWCGPRQVLDGTPSETPILLRLCESSVAVMNT